MAHYIAFDGKGKEVQRGFCMDGHEQYQCDHEHLLLIEETRELVYYDSGKVIEMPPSPGEYYFFDYDIKEWVEDTDPARRWADIRQRRDYLLSNSDWTQLPDVPESVKVRWSEYRQQLRDITLQPDPFNLVWPEEP